MRREYQITGRKGNAALRQFLAKEGAGLLPMMELLEAGKLAVEELVGEMGKAALEAVLLLSAQQVAGPAHPGRPGGATGMEVMGVSPLLCARRTGAVHVLASARARCATACSSWALAASTMRRSSRRSSGLAMSKHWSLGCCSGRYSLALRHTAASCE